MTTLRTEADSSLSTVGKADIATGTGTVLLAAGSAPRRLTTLRVCNRGATTTFRLAWVSGGTTYYLCYDRSIAANTDTLIDIGDLEIGESDTLVGIAGAVSSLHVIFSYAEATR